MRSRRLPVVLAAASLLVGAFASAASADRPADTGGGASDAGIQHRNVPVCNRPPVGFAGCHAIRQDDVDASGRPVSNGKPTSSTPSGYGPADIQAAYGLASTSTATVAVVDAYNDPTAEADLGVYRKKMGLTDCTTTNGCFRKTSQSGSVSTLPVVNASWAQEISLDLDMVSAACPSCHILLVEANSNSFADLGAAVNYAATVGGVKAISNSYGGSDSAPSGDYSHDGIAVTASTGDNGFGVESPASFDSVVAVGGTSLRKSGGVFSETAWSGAGSGCSTLNAKPDWQTAATGCSGKANADVSAVADPNTGVAVYDSTAYQGRSGWMKFGGTSASSPIIASVYAMAGHGSSFTSQTPAAAYTWAHASPSTLHDITSGSNGTCSTVQWCSAISGWDGPTGLGTPNGISAF